MNQPPLIFDRKQVRRQQKRAMANLAGHDFLLQAATERLLERLDDVTHSFPLAAYLGRVAFPPHAKIGHCLQSSRHFECDEAYPPFGDETLDAVISPLALHWCNDLPGTLVQLRRALKPDGLLLISLFGGATLNELRAALEEATIEMEGGLKAYVSPFVDVRDAGMLLQRAGFALPVVDSEPLTVSYAHAFDLMRDLRGMGEGNALISRHKAFSRRNTFMRTAEIYQQRFADAEGRISATFELVTLTAWKPHASQQAPAKRGSGKVSLHSALSDLK